MGRLESDDGGLDRGDDPIGCNRADEAIARIRNEDAYRRIDRDAAGRVEARWAVAAVPGARHRHRRCQPASAPGRPVDDADAVVVGVGDDDAARGVHRHADWRVEASLRGGSVDVPGGAVARDGGHGAVRRDASDGVVARVGHDQRAVGRQRDGRRRGEPRLRAAPVREPPFAAGQRRHRAIGSDAADAMRLPRVAHEHRAVRRHREAERLGEARLLGRAIPPAIPAVAGEDADGADPCRFGRLGTRQPPRRADGGDERDDEERPDGASEPHVCMVGPLTAIART